MFKAISDKSNERLVSIFIDEEPFDVPEGETVASAMLQVGLNNFRDTPVQGEPRGPFCMMGICFDCLVVIDGLSDQQACMTIVKNGMHIKRQKGSADLFSLSDVTEHIIK